MPVLGSGGVVEFRRELPEPALVSAEAVVAHANALSLSNEAFWTGDKVWIWGPTGLPFDLNEDELPDVRGGWGMFFGSKYLLYGQRKTRLTNGSKKWFGPEDPFRAPTIEGVTDRTELYIYRDELDRVSFYRTLSKALGGEPEDRLAFYAVDFRFLLIAPEGGSGYKQRLEPAYPELGSYRFPEGVTEYALSTVTDAAIPEPTGPDSDRPWCFLAEMDEWSLELNSTEIDTTGLGERYGESTRALVTGGGQLNFYVNRNQTSSEVDATFIARLLTTLEQGSAAEAVFNLTTAKTAPFTPNNAKRYPIGKACYKAKLLIVNNATNTSADDVIRGTARFVTVGRIKLDLS